MCNYHQILHDHTKSTSGYHAISWTDETVCNLFLQRIKKTFYTCNPNSHFVRVDELVSDDNYIRQLSQFGLWITFNLLFSEYLTTNQRKVQFCILKKNNDH